MEKANELFAMNLKRFMKYYDFTQEQLGNKLGYSRQAVGTWTSGKKFPRLGTVDDMTKIFHCSRGDLLEREMTDERIYKAGRVNKLWSFIDKLNDDGIEKAITFFEDLNPKFYKDEEGVSK